MIKVLIIDNNDSFTYNLVELLRQINSCEVAVCLLPDLKLESVFNFDALIISPGPGLPCERPSLKSILDVVVGKLPIFGVCLGHQALLEYFGAKLKPLNTIVHGEASLINFLKSDALFTGCKAPIEVGRYHSWVVDGNTIPESIEIGSQTNSGLVMSFYHKQYNVRGVQFHPESILTPHGKQMLSNWLKLCM